MFNTLWIFMLSHKEVQIPNGILNHDPISNFLCHQQIKIGIRLEMMQDNTNPCTFNHRSQRKKETLANVLKNGKNSSTTTIAMVAPLQYAKWKNNNEWRQWMKIVKLNTPKWKSLCYIKNYKACVSCNKNEKTWTKEGWWFNVA